mmetsp:Transcript_40805/g.65711  ORF Transcript_40805/g.65711 Transcript_40805/m.65711 type:complete len:218 (-) Transcript_40805:849-1502(-)
MAAVLSAGEATTLCASTSDSVLLKPAASCRSDASSLGRTPRATNPFHVSSSESLSESGRLTPSPRLGTSIPATPSAPSARKPGLKSACGWNWAADRAAFLPAGGRTTNLCGLGSSNATASRGLPNSHLASAPDFGGPCTSRLSSSPVVPAPDVDGWATSQRCGFFRGGDDEDALRADLHPSTSFPVDSIRVQGPSSSSRRMGYCTLAAGGLCVLSMC